MNLIAHLQNLFEAQNPAANYPEPEEIISVFKSYFNKKAVIENLSSIKKRTLRAANDLLVNTKRFKKALEDPDIVEQLNALSRQKKFRGAGYWASRLINVELLQSAIQQLKDSKTRVQMLLSLARLLQVVEDLDFDISADPWGEVGPHNNIYKYMMRIQAWTPQQVKTFNDLLRGFSDRLAQSLADKVLAAEKLKTKRKATSRPAGW